MATSRSMDCLATEVRAPLSCLNAAGATKPMSSPSIAITTKISSRVNPASRTEAFLPGATGAEMVRLSPRRVG